MNNYCVYCGKEMNKNEEYCVYCGVKNNNSIDNTINVNGLSIAGFVIGIVTTIVAIMVLIFL